jgi:CDP-diacylglycerol--glycerol-3-phosphate 3-phosphatidyltransferase
VIAASMWGKTKTVSQMVMIVLLIVYVTSGPFYILTQAVVYLACLLTVVSLVDYIMKNRNVLTMQN